MPEEKYCVGCLQNLWLLISVFYFMYNVWNRQECMHDATLELLFEIYFSFLGYLYTWKFMFSYYKGDVLSFSYAHSAIHFRLLMVSISFCIPWTWSVYFTITEAMICFQTGLDKVNCYSSHVLKGVLELLFRDIRLLQKKVIFRVTDDIFEINFYNIKLV